MFWNNVSRILEIYSFYRRGKSACLRWSRGIYERMGILFSNPSYHMFVVSCPYNESESCIAKLCILNVFERALNRSLRSSVKLQWFGHLPVHFHHFTFGKCAQGEPSLRDFDREPRRRLHASNHLVNPLWMPPSVWHLDNLASSLLLMRLRVQQRLKNQNIMKDKEAGRETSHLVYSSLISNDFDNFMAMIDLNKHLSFWEVVTL